MRFGKRPSIAELRSMVVARRQRRYSTFNQAILWIHYLLILALLFSVSAKYISPALFWVPAFFGLAFPYLFVVNLLFLAYWTAQFRSMAVVSAIVMVAGFPTAFRYVQFSLGSSHPEGKTLKVTSYNSMLFDLYNWSNNKERRSRILGNLSDLNPDILCLQEFYTSEQAGDFNNIDTVRRMLHTDHYHTAYTTTLRDNDHWGIATFSKYPIINRGKIVFNTKSNNICIYTDIVAGADTIRVYNVHLQSISFSRKDNKFLEDVLSKKNAADEMEQSRSILRRLKRAFIKRSQQAEMVALHIQTCRYKVILCGDFNDTPASYTYERLSNGLEDAFIARGVGFGRTYAGKWPQFRIDYILHDQRLRCVAYERSQETITDHFAITAVLENIAWHSNGK